MTAMTKAAVEVTAPAAGVPYSVLDTVFFVVGGVGGRVADLAAGAAELSMRAARRSVTLACSRRIVSSTLLRRSYLGARFWHPKVGGDLDSPVEAGARCQ
jgi:hypothetical protein